MRLRLGPPCFPGYEFAVISYGLFELKIYLLSPRGLGTVAALPPRRAFGVVEAAQWIATDLCAEPYGWAVGVMVMGWG